jgi:hypothetical protein
MKTFRWILAGAIAVSMSPARAQDDAPREDAKPCYIRMKNGSSFSGLVRGISRVPLRTKYGVMEIPPADVTSIRLGDVEKEERDSVATKDGGTLRGWLDSWKNTFEVNTGFGVLRIPLKDVRSLDFRGVQKGPWSKTEREWPAFVAGDAEPAARSFQVRLKERLTLRGALRDLREMKFETKYATLKVPVRDVKSLLLGGSRDILVTAEGPFEGSLRLSGEEVALDTGWGVVTLPAKDVASIHQGTRGFGDDFEADSLEGWTSYGGTWKTSGGRLEISGTNNYNTVVLYNEALPETYSLEVDCQGTQGLGLLWGAQNQSQAIALWINQNIAYVLGGGSWWNWQQLAQWAITVPANEFYRVRLDVDGETAVIFINDKQIGTVKTGAKGGKVGLFCYSGSAKFDNFWIR